MILMPYIREERGLINNFADEPKVYQTEPPTSNQKRNYLLLGIGCILLVGGLLYVAVSVS